MAAERVKAGRQVDVGAAEAALGEDGGDVGGEFRGTRIGGVDHHAREPRR